MGQQTAQAKKVYCTFCNEEPESIEHLLSRSKVSSEFWKEVLSWLKENNIIS